MKFVEVFFRILDFVFLTLKLVDMKTHVEIVLLGGERVILHKKDILSVASVDTPDWIKAKYSDYVSDKITLIQTVNHRYKDNGNGDEDGLYSNEMTSSLYLSTPYIFFKRKLT